MSEQSTTRDRGGLVREGIEAASRGDVEGALDVYAPDAVWDMSLLGLGSYAGHSEIRGFFSDWMGAYESYGNELREFVELGEEVTLSVVEQWGRPAGSSAELRLLYAAVATWESAKIVHATLHTDIDAARAEARRLAGER